MGEKKILRMRCHFSIIFESLWKFWAVILIGFLGEIDTLFELVEEIGREGISEAVEGGGLWGFAVLAGITAVVFLIQYLRWRKTWVILEDNLVIIEKNTVNRKRNTIAIENISAVNIERNIFERLVGTSRIKMDTNSMTTAEETDVSIVFSERKAMEFRNAVVERMNMVSGAAQEEVQVQYEDAVVYSYSVMEILKHNIFSVSIFNILAAVGGTVGTLWLYLNLDEGDSFGSVLTAAIFVMGLAYNLIKRFITYYNFSVYRMGDDIHLKYGLLKLKNYTVPIGKITAIKLMQPTLSRIAGLYQVQIITVGLGDEEGEMSNLTMTLSKDTMISQMKVLLPEYNIEGFDEKILKEENAAVKIKAAKSIKWGILAVIAVVIASEAASVPWLISAGCGILFMVFVYSLYMLAHVTAGYCMEEEQLILADGHFAKEYTICKYKKIQTVSMTSGPLERKLGIVDGMIELLNTNAVIPYVKPDVMEKISEKILL